MAWPTELQGRKVPASWGEGRDPAWKEGWTLEMENYAEDLKLAENDRKAGYDEKTGLWRSHPSLEGGFNTLGYGIKLTYDDSGDIYTDNEINDMFYEKLFTNYLTVHNKYTSRSKGKDSAEWDKGWNDLTNEEKIVLTELQYNTKSSKDGKPDLDSILEKVMKALGEGDHSTAKELILKRGYYDKKGKFHVLDKRNQEIITKYLN